MWGDLLFSFLYFSFHLVPVKDVLEGIEELIPSFRGVKFSGSDLMDFGQCVSDSPPHWSFLYGMDEVGSVSISPLIDSCLSGKKSYDSDLHSLSFHSNCLQLWRWGPMEQLGGPCAFLHSASSPLVLFSYLHAFHFSACSTYNYAGCHFNKLIAAFKEGHVVQARKIQVRPSCCCFRFHVDFFFLAFISFLTSFV